jgi:hypothetical protein
MQPKFNPAGAEWASGPDSIICEPIEVERGALAGSVMLARVEVGGVFGRSLEGRTVALDGGMVRALPAAAGETGRLVARVEAVLAVLADGDDGAELGDDGATVERFGPDGERYTGADEGAGAPVVEGWRSEPRTGGPVVEVGVELGPVSEPFDWRAGRPGAAVPVEGAGAAASVEDAARAVVDAGPVPIVVDGASSGAEGAGDE